jgi:hypothetical protein
MGKTRDYCFKHSQMFDGWQCPQCAEEHAGDPGDAPNGETTPADSPSDVGGPASVLSREKSESEATAKCSQAERLLRNGDARAALEMAEQAIEHHERNLTAHLVGARAARALLDFGREHELLAAATQLLSAPPYFGDCAATLEVLKYARDPKLAGAAARTFASVPKRTGTDVQRIVHVLMARSLFSDAIVMLDSLPPEDRTLATCAYTFQLTSRPFVKSDPEIGRFLRKIGAERRADILSDLLALREDTTILPSTADLLQKALRSRYDEWAADIGRELTDEAKRRAAESVGREWVSSARSAAIKFAAGACVLSGLLMYIGGVWIGLAVGIPFVYLATRAGYAYGRDEEMRRLTVELLHTIKEQLAREELDRWMPILDDDAYKQTAPNRKEGVTATAACPYCSEPVADDAASCPKCRRTLDAASAPAVTDTPAPGEETTLPR